MYHAQMAAERDNATATGTTEDGDGCREETPPKSLAHRNGIRGPFSIVRATTLLIPALKDNTCPRRNEPLTVVHSVSFTFLRLLFFFRERFSKCVMPGTIFLTVVSSETHLRLSHSSVSRRDPVQILPPGSHERSPLTNGKSSRKIIREACVQILLIRAYE